ncbi:MAG TPA: DNA-binding response regulator [Desulfobacteraceae bacterium]|nr:DNA-binding response regulator [Desulfobacteraceae bacterium]
MTTIKILVAEDDPNIRTGLTDTLESENYRVIQAADGRQALSLFKETTPDLILLDIMMPGKSGYDVCRDIRSEDKQVPIIMLTAKGEEIDKVVGLQLGADDYITKPFGIHELLARIEAVLRRSGHKNQTCRVSKSPEGKTAFPFAAFTVDPRTYTLSGPAGAHDLSKRELDLIRLFANHPGEVLEREFILARIWGEDYPGTTRTLDQHIAMLRKKVEPTPGCPECIVTVHGIGYRYTGQYRTLPETNE